MNTSSPQTIPQFADKLFLALGQTLYACQLFEATLLEVLAHTHELLDGTGDGTRFQESIETLSRKTLGQLLHEFRKRADIREDIEGRLSAGLEARNFVVHHFAEHVGDDLSAEPEISAHQRVVYEKCAVVMGANDAGLDLLNAIAKLNAARSGAMANELEEKTNAMRELASRYSELRH